MTKGRTYEISVVLSTRLWSSDYLHQIIIRNLQTYEISVVFCLLVFGPVIIYVKSSIETSHFCWSFCGVYLHSFRTSITHWHHMYFHVSNKLWNFHSWMEMGTWFRRKKYVDHLCPCSSNCLCQIINRNYIGLWFSKHLTCFCSHVLILFVRYVCIVSGLASLVCFFCFYFIMWLLFWSYVFVVEGMCRIPWMWWVATGPRDHLVAVKAWHITRRCGHQFCSNQAYLHHCWVSNSPWFPISFVTFPVSCYVPKAGCPPCCRFVDVVQFHQ